jgi:hypothetical protein
MLQVSTAVHELVGGVVDHVPQDEQDMTETAMMLHKLYSMNLMAMRGGTPTWSYGRCVTSLLLLLLVVVLVVVVVVVV